MRLVMLILIPPLLLFVLALAMMWIPLPAPFPPPGSSGRNRLTALAIGALGVVYLVSVGIYAISWLRASHQALDTALTSRGLSPQGYLVFGQQYHGTVQGRQVDAYYTPAQGASPASLDIHVAADVGTQAAVGPERPLVGCGGCPTVMLADPDLDHLHLLAQDEAWLRDLLAEPVNKAALVRLLDDQETLGLREVYFELDRVWLRAHPRQAADTHVEQWLDDLLMLAEAAEAR